MYKKKLYEESFTASNLLRVNWINKVDYLHCLGDNKGKTAGNAVGLLGWRLTHTVCSDGRLQGQHIAER